MTKILYISQFYPPESIAGAFRAKEHAARWAEGGHSVTVLTAWPNYPTGRIFEGYSPQLLREFSDGTVRVLRSKLIPRPNRSFLGRIAGGASFLFFGCLNVLVRGKKIGSGYDVVLASSGTVFAGYIGLLYATLRRLPFVVEFRDITFEQMVAAGSERSDWKVRLMRSLELRLARKAKAIVVLTEGFKGLLADQGVAPSDIFVVPNGADVCELDASTECDEVCLGYFGTMGISQNVPETLEVARQIASIVPIRYTLIGEGAAREEVEHSLNEDYPFAQILHGMPQDELEPFYGACDFTFVTLKRSEAFAATVPSKIFQSFARGVPVIFLGPDGEAAKIVRDNSAGLVLCGCDEDNKQVLLSFFGRADWRERARELGVNAQRLVEKKYSRTVLADRMLEILQDVSDVERSNDA